MATIHGKNAAVYLQGSGAEAVLLTEAADWSLTFDYDAPSDNAFGDTYESYLQGLIKGSGTIQGNYDTTQSNIFDAVSAGASRKFYLYATRSDTARYYYGLLWPKLTANVPMGVAKFTLPFVTDGVISVK